MSDILGQVIGVCLLIIAHFHIWRYLLVYYLLNGSKSEYAQEKQIPILVGVTLLAPVMLLVVRAVVGGSLIVGLLILGTLFYAAYALRQMWNNSDELPNPFTGKERVSKSANYHD